MFEAGQQLSHYRLTEKIGQGGMGEVWKAVDVRLDREVALKFLPDVVARDADRLDRFEREAKLLASLNHPAIATIHDVGEHGGVRFLVMEYVPGLDLAEALRSGPMPVRQALEVALQIARAVEAAHAQGVVHRDLKPANVKRTPGSSIKVLDFGLAKALGPDASSSDPSVSLSPTVTSAGTIAGVILGTAAYMSPEQARGRTIDKRTDVWSFGVVLYELLTGGNPFRGETVADSVGAILHREPDLDLLPEGTPSGIRRLLRRCLTRDRDRRLHDIADARIEIEEAIEHPDETDGVATSGAPAVAAPPSRMPWAVLALAVPIVAALAWWAGSRETPPTPAAVRQFELVPDVEVDEVDLSPDGARIAYRVGNDVFVRSLDALESRPIRAGGDQPIQSVFWSPDGRSLGLLEGPGEIRRVDLDGSAPTVLANLDTFVNDPAWGDDGFIYFAKFQGGIARLPESGGASEDFLDAHPGMIDYHGVSLLPGGRGILTVPHLKSGDPRVIFLERAGAEPRVVYECDGVIGRVSYSATGHLLYQRDDNPRGMWALPFSLERLEVTGAPFLVVPDLDVVTVSDRGDLAYSKAAVQSGRQKQQVVWADRTGATVDRLDMDLYGATTLALSPDRSRLAIVARGIGRPSTGKPNLWVIDLERKTSTRLTEEGVVPSTAIWSADGNRIAYLRQAGGPDEPEAILAVRVDGTGEPETLLEADITFFASLNADWSMVAFMTGSLGDENGVRIDVEAIGDPSTLRTFADGPGHQVAPAIHPDGHWIAYMSGDLVSMDTYVRPFPEGEGRWKASTDRGGFPIWSRDGSRLYVATMPGAEGVTRILEIAFDGSGREPKLGRPVELFTVDDDDNTFDVAPDDRILRVVDREIPEGEEAPDTTGILLVEHWLSRFPD